MSGGASARPYPRYVAGTRAPATWGLFTFIATESILFSLLFSSYFYLRSSATEWPQGGIAASDLRVPAINTVILLASSVPLFWAEHSIKRGNQTGLRVGFALSFLLGAIFLALQLREYSRLPFQANANAYASLYFVITGFHGVHVFVGMLMNGMTQARAWAGHFDEKRYLGVQNASWYWHFVDVVWIFVFAIVYISPHVL